jgi:SAM-dependent methyltransferase
MSQVSPRWTDAGTVAGFEAGSPNPVLLEFAGRFAAVRPRPRCLDIGCGAARNALPLAELGFRVAATDLSLPMLEGARRRIAAANPTRSVDVIRAPMAPLPFADASFDLVVAHGIWNLARSGAEFRAAAAEAARVARPGAGLFVFTFSRRTLPPAATPDEGEAFVFSSWNGEPQCFLTESALVHELGVAGFDRDQPGPLTEYNVPRPGELRAGGPPVIYEGTFVRSAARAQLPDRKSR